MVRGDPAMRSFFDKTADFFSEHFGGTPSVATMRKVLAASRETGRNAMERLRKASSASAEHYRNVAQSPELGAGGASAYASFHNSAFSSVPGAARLDAGQIVAPDIAGGENRSTKKAAAKAAKNKQEKPAPAPVPDRPVDDILGDIKGIQ